jgi:hypothetical protein
MNEFSAKKILILAANPITSSPLRLGEEVREIDEGLRRTQHSSQFELVSKWAVRSRDFYRYMLDVQPYIIHFSGHGTGEDGIVLEDDTGKAHLVPTDALERLFKLFSNKGLECVLLNACFSEVQADAISKHIPYVVGMKKGIGDKAAIIFASAFYDALAATETVDFAFDLACTAIQMEGIPEYFTPVLKKNPDIIQNLSPFKERLKEKDFLSSRYQRLEQEREQLQETYDLYHKKLLSLRKAYAIETDVAVKLKLDTQIEETEKAIRKVELELGSIEQRLA